MKTNILAALLVPLLASVVSGTEDPQDISQCQWELAYPTDVFEFPKTGSGDTAVKYLNVVPNFNPSLTLCLWAKFEDFSEITPVMRLVNSDGKISFSIETHPPATVRFSDGEFNFVHPLKMNTSYPYHICIDLNPEAKLARLYLNGLDIGEVPWGFFYVGPNDRSLLIGGKNGGAQFKGHLSNFVAYDRVLSQIEVQQMAYNCERPTDDVLFTNLEKVELLGDARYQSNVDCPSRTYSIYQWLREFYDSLN